MAERGGGETSTLDARLSEATMAFNTALAAGQYDGQAVAEAFAGVETVVSEAAESGVKSPADAFGTLGELSNAVVDVAKANGDKQQATIFGARSRSYAASVRLLQPVETATSPPPVAEPRPAKAPGSRRARSTATGTTRAGATARRGE